MSYRVETASSGRAVCKATECKDHGIKIEKDELRLGVWVSYEDRGSWSWRHWGCVSGKQLQNIRQQIEDPSNPGYYRFDALDGYEGDEKNSLDKTPDLQLKVRRVITQGFIDPEDWNGDEEMNKLGETGLRTKEHKQQMMAEKRQGKHDIEELRQKLGAENAAYEELRAAGKSTVKKEAQIANLKAAIDGKSANPVKSEGTPKKRVRAEGAEEAEAAKPAKKKRASKKTTKEESSDEEEKQKPAKKRRARKAKKKESEDEDVDMKLEDEIETEDVKPVKKNRVKKLVKKEEEEVSDEDAEVMPAPSKRARVKKEETVKAEQNDDVSLSAPAAKKSAKGKKSVKEEEHEEDEIKTVNRKEPKKGRGKNTTKQEQVEGDENVTQAKVEDTSGKVDPVKGKSKDGINGLADIPDINGGGKDEDATEDEVIKGENFKIEASEEEEKKPVKNRAGRAKKGKIASAPVSARGSRSRVSSKR